VSGAAQAPPQETHHEPELQDLRQQLNYKNAEATNLRTNLAAVQSELTAAKLAAARGAISGGGRHDGEASRLRREIQQLRTKLEFAEQARREMQHLPTVPQALQRRTTAVQTDRAEHLPCAMTSALSFLPPRRRPLVRARHY
jgi:predicted  nucleic acid-binding Zn-ribbon protein